jgi:hypothetical protein
VPVQAPGLIGSYGCRMATALRAVQAKALKWTVWACLRHVPWSAGHRPRLVYVDTLDVCLADGDPVRSSAQLPFVEAPSDEAEPRVSSNFRQEIQWPFS